MGKYWRAIYTKPRNEKKIFQRLQEKGIEAYCPLQKTLKQWSDRKKLVSQPLFTSYLFVKVNESERLAVLQDPGVIQYVFWLGKPATIRDEEINAMKEFLNEYPDSCPESISCAQGDNVKIIQGPLKDCRGIITETTRKSVILRLEVIGWQLTAKIHKTKLTLA